jgi:hypothetical protein
VFERCGLSSQRLPAPGSEASLDPRRPWGRVDVKVLVVATRVCGASKGIDCVMSKTLWRIYTKSSRSGIQKY